MKYVKLLLVMFAVSLMFSSGMADENLGVDLPSKSGDMKSDSKKEALDGLKYEGTVTEKGKEKSDKDVVEFMNGKFLSRECVPYGFSTASYSAKKKDDGSIEFKSEVPSSKNNSEKIIWVGTVKGKYLSGTMKWIDKSGKATEYEVKMSKLIDE